MFHLDAKNEEKVKNALKISLALPEYLLANASRQVEFYIPAVEIFTQSAKPKKTASKSNNNYWKHRKC